MTDAKGLTVADVIASVELRDVRLMESTAKTRVRDPKTIPEARLTLSHGTNLINRFPDAFWIGARLVAAIASGRAAEGEASPINIDATFVLTYALPNADEYSDEVLEDFARINSVFNAWPYWREYIQATAARMSLPPVVLPVFRLPRPSGRAEAVGKARRQPKSSRVRAGSRPK
jgi:hypothetical protein